MIEQRFEGMARADHVAQKLTTRTFPFVSFRGNAVPSGAFLSVKSRVRERPHFSSALARWKNANFVVSEKQILA